MFYGSGSADIMSWSSDWGGGIAMPKLNSLIIHINNNKKVLENLDSVKANWQSAEHTHTL